ncbi:hypothetical protein HXX76_013655 [Chlamydomonas incerta]|uniref:Rubredoxin-like domain-containing protein n=1 Tax=Chlamydomonas incerta TaxID=51695 RepID=A0A835SRG8_CHLIN|nr:hypothetical protein HXX76_013655 [Chlamydomonas incerta]|eukprot:KAG2425445.1 hypothetical protein HXX76_013655 [Chlamydomonas incerta]
MAALQKSFLGNKAGFKSAVRGSASRQSSVAVSALFQKTKATPKSAYVCLDCGYLYDGPTPFEEVKAYVCPVCNAPKRRFKELRGNKLTRNDPKSMSSRKEALIAQVEADGGSADEGQNEFLIFSGLTAVAALGFLAYLNMPK